MCPIPTTTARVGAGPAPTAFHSTLTNPHLLRLADGRILFFFNNTRPLPEQAKDDVWPPLSEDEKRGVWEDVFTNRDANWRRRLRGRRKKLVWLPRAEPEQPAQYL